MRKPLEFAELEWDENGQPRSTQFNDIYFATAKTDDSELNGLAESRYVFLHNNKLTQRWSSLEPGQHFVIGETGFGTGLNFLATWQLWNKSVTNDSHLHFISIEKHPLNKSQLNHALTAWPELASLAKQLIEAYPDLLTTGFFPIHFGADNVSLLLIIDDVAGALEQLLQSTHPHFRRPFGHGIDAWFLDGFAPKLNPEMWSANVLTTIGELSHPGSTLATFTAAGEVRRGLKQAGFTITKVPGFGNKRDMITAEFTGFSHPEISLPSPGRSSPFPIPWSVGIDSDPTTKAATIIGAGFAGCHTARELALRGWKVTVLDRQNTIAGGASGNAQGVVYAKLSADDDALADFNWQAMFTAQQEYGKILSNHPDIGKACGLMQLAHDAKEERWWQGCYELLAGQTSDLTPIQFLSPQAASVIAGTKIKHRALYFANLGWLSPVALCRHLVDHPNIQIQTSREVSNIVFDDDSHQWRLLDNNDNLIHTSTNLIIATAADAKRFAPCSQLPLNSIGGQLTYLKDNQIIRDVQTVICGDTYIAPPANFGDDIVQSIGASFRLQETSLELCAAEHRDNINQIAALLPDLGAQLQALDFASLSGRTGVRCSTPDYLPIVGPVHNHAAFVEQYPLLRKNAKAGYHQPGPYWPGLYINVGHGSRGLAYTPLCAKLLAALLNGEPLPVAQSLFQALHPGRFTIRGLMRRKF